MNDFAIINTSNLTGIQNFASYKKYVAAIPNLSEEQERHLLTKLKLENCLASAQELIMSQLKTVVHIAFQYRNYGLPEEDLVQEGNIGLMKAVKNFNLAHKVRLYSYALIWIKAEIQGYILKNWKLVKIGTTKNFKKLFFNFKSMQKELIDQGIPKNQLNYMVSERLGVDITEVNEIENYFSSEDVVIELDNEDAPVMQIGHNQTPETMYMEEHDTEKANTALTNALECLNEKQKEVIQLRFFCEEKKTHKEIAQMIGVSSERIRQIEQEAILKMKKALNADSSIQGLYN